MNYTTLFRLYVWSLVIVFALITLHAPLTVWLSSQFPDQELLIKSWKEIVLLVLIPVGIGLANHKKIVGKLLRDPLFMAIIGYGVLHLFLGLFGDELSPLLAGLMIDLRFVVFFTLIYIALNLDASYRRQFLVAGLAMATVVLGFAVLQVFVLPKDILAAIGYGKQTIMPYLTVDENPALVRINSTMRGPNPLGAYGGIILAITAAFAIKRRPFTTPWRLGLLALAAGAVLAVLVSYSRSALVGAIGAVVVVFVSVFVHRLPAKAWASLGVVSVLALMGMLFALRDTTFVQQIILHDDPMTQSPVNSNEQHADSLAIGFGRLLAQPIGAGIGSTGSASLYGSEPFILENQFLFVAHESGWLGLALFLSIFLMIMWRLWRRRDDWLALGVFASGIGLSGIGILLPVWADDTLCFVWWGLAAIALMPKSGIINYHGTHAPKQKTTRAT
jgi:hypothetical protein